MAHRFTPLTAGHQSDSNQPPVAPGSLPFQERFDQEYVPYPNLSIPPPPAFPRLVGVSHPAPQFVADRFQWNQNPISEAPQFVADRHQWNQNPIPVTPRSAPQFMADRPQWNQSPIRDISQYHSENTFNAGKQHGMVPRDRNTSIESDELWVQRYLAAKGQAKEPDKTLKRISTTGMLQIGNAQEVVDVCVRIVQDLKTLEKELKDNINVLNPEKWEEKCVIIASKKAVLTRNIATLSAPAVADHLCLAVAKRLKKRQRQMRQRALRKKARAEAGARREQSHKELDEWLREVQLGVDKTKAEESLKRQADLVLGDVTRKQLEARRQLALLAKLVKLRQLRVQAATSRGERVSTEQVEIFENVADKLKTFWSEQMRGYDVEETGLRVMLEEESQGKKKSVTSNLQGCFNQWRRVMFGRNTHGENPYLLAERDVQSFIAVRHDWDKFIVPSGAPMASSIPVGWVMPGNPSSADWAELINSKQNHCQVQLNTTGTY